MTQPAIPSRPSGNWRGRLASRAPTFVAFTERSRSTLDGWLSQRTPRERLLLLAGAIVLILAAYVLLVWQPLNEARDATLQRIAILDRVIAQAETIDPAKIAAPVTSDVPPATAITNAAAEYGLAIKRIEPDGAQTRVTLEDIKFDTLLLWLEKMSKDYTLGVSGLELERRPEPGVVTARVVFQR